MYTSERSSDIYERIPAYPLPPLPPVPEPGNLSALEDCGVRLNALSEPIIRIALWLTGFSSFWCSLSRNLDAILRRTNIRGPRLFAPAVAATLALEDDPGCPGPALRAATLAAGARELYEQVASGRLLPDEVRGRPAEMAQYLNLFATNITFEGKRPRLFKSGRPPRILVMARGRFYMLPLREPATMARALARIWQTATSAPPAGLSAAILTSASERLQIREVPRLAKVLQNRRTLEELRHTFLTLCLEFDSSPETFAEAARLAHSGNLSSRWQYSSLQMVIFANSKAAAICSYSACLDGNTMARGTAEIQKNAVRIGMLEHSRAATIPIVELRWEVPDRVLERAVRSIGPAPDNQQATFEIPGAGTQFFADNNIPPVPSFVVALQMATRRLIGEPARITQFVSMSRYRCMGHGLAEVTTPQVVRFLAQYEQVSSEAACVLFDEAVRSQTERCSRARSALGFEDLISLFLESSHGFIRPFRMAVAGSASLLLRVLGLRRPRRHQILISSPAIFPEIKIVGRPGARLPYLKYFGLHYQIFDDRIVLTIMPSTSWKFSNRLLVAEVSAALAAISSIQRGGSAAFPPTAKSLRHSAN